MSYTAFTAMLDLARVMVDVVESTATSDGAAGKTTLVDSAIRGTPPDDHFNNGTIFFRSCTNTALNSTTAKITDFATATGTYTFPAAAAQTKTGDTYAACTVDCPRDVLLRAVNQALQDIGEVSKIDDTLTTVADQESYSLPSGVYNVDQVWVAQSLTSPYDYLPHFGNYELNGKLYFDQGQIPSATGYIIRLVYSGVHAELTADSSTISDMIPRPLLQRAAADRLFEWLVERYRTDRPDIIARANTAIARLGERKAVNRVKKQPRFPHLGGW